MRDKSFEAQFQDEYLHGRLKRTNADNFYPQVLRKGEEGWSIAQIGDIHDQKILVPFFAVASQFTDFCRSTNSL